MTLAPTREIPAATRAARCSGGPGARAFASSPPAPLPDNRTVAETDRDDIEACLGGDGSAYERLIRRHQGDVARRMWRFTRDPRELDELVHEVFVEAYFSLAGYRGTGPLRHWLGKVAVRVGYRHWQRKARRSADVPLQDWDAPAGDPAADAAADVVHGVLAQLPPRDRLVVTLMYLEGRSVAEAADIAGWSQTMTRVQAWRAKRKLKALLAEAGFPTRPAKETKP